MLRNAFRHYLKNFLLLGGIFIAVVYVGVQPFNAYGASPDIEIFSAYDDTTPSYQMWGRTSTQQAMGWTILTQSSQYLCSVEMNLRKNNSPTDQISLTLYRSSLATTTSLSTGVELATSIAIGGSSLPASGDTLTRFEFENCQYLSGAVHYNLILSRQTLHDTNNYSIGYTGLVNSTYIRSFEFDGTWDIKAANNWQLKAYGLESLDITESMLSSSTNIAYQTGYFANCTNATTSDSLLSQIGCVLFNPQFGLGFMTDAFQDFQEVFPFSVFFGTINTVQDAATDYASSGQTLALTVGFPGADLIYTTSSVSLLTPTTLADHGFGATVLNWWYNIIIMICLVVVAWAIFTAIYHPN